MRWTAHHLLIFACVLASGCSSAEPVSPRPPVPAPLAVMMQPETPLVIAHRGGRTDGPEETIESMRLARAAGADVLELDLHRTADGVVVCMHDAVVDRTTDGTGPIAELDWSALQALDAGFHFSPPGTEAHPFRGQGVRVPSLKIVLEAFPDVPFILEIKQSEPPIVDDVLAVLRDAGALDRVVLASFSADTLAAVRRAPDAPATSLAASEVASWLWDDDNIAPGAFLHLPPSLGMDLVTPALLDRAHGEGLAVQVWTISEEAEMRAMVALGVDGVMTTDPGRMRRVVDER